MKNLSAILLFCLAAQVASAQAKLNLTLLPGGKTVAVGVLPEKTWAAPMNMVASGAQVVLRVPATAGFSPAIASSIADLHWADSYYVENPAQDSGYTYICIALVEQATTKILLTTGVETRLFEFSIAGSDCPGAVEILENSDPRVQAVRAGGFNVTQNMAVLGAGKNILDGIQNGSIECSTVSGTENAGANTFSLDKVEVYPSPAHENLQIRWENTENFSANLLLIVSDANGREIERRTVGGQRGPGNQILNVRQWPNGLYNFRFAQASGRKSRAWNFVVSHP